MQMLGLGSRLWLALTLPWKLLFDGAFAASTKALAEGHAQPALTPAMEPARAKEVVVQEAERDESAALQLLSILQREGRFVDFLQDDLTGASDADIGAAARVVHEGCKRGLKDYIELAAIRSEEEGASIELAAGFDAVRHRVTGNVTGEAPYKGVLAHHGWEATRFSLPSLSAAHDPMVIAPAEVDL